MNLLIRLKDIQQKTGLNRNTKLKITCIDGQILQGSYFGYTQALDNEPEIDQIEIRENDKECITAILENEIKEIDVLS